MNVFLWNARARNIHVEATLNHPFPAQVPRGDDGRVGLCRPRALRPPAENPPRALPGHRRPPPHGRRPRRRAPAPRGLPRQTDEELQRRLLRQARGLLRGPRHPARQNRHALHGLPPPDQVHGQEPRLRRRRPGHPRGPRLRRRRVHRRGPGRGLREDGLRGDLRPLGRRLLRRDRRDPPRDRGPRRRARAAPPRRRSDLGS